MKSTMANLWHPIRGVQIRDLGGKRYLFQFFHVMDMERVLKGSPWTFNNHLLLLHKLKLMEDPLIVPLIYTPFWVQIHDIPAGFFSERLAIQLGNFIGAFMEYDGSNLGKENRNFMRIRVKIDVRYPLKRKKQILFFGKSSYVRFKYERISLFCFYCGRLGHSDSFCEAKMAIGAEVGEMGWDLSLRAQSRRAIAMNSVWLREDVEDWVGTTEERQGLRPSTRVPRGSLGQYRNIDPILGFNLEGQSPFFKKSENSYTLMDHDSEDRVIALEEGKKRTRREIDEALVKEDDSTLAVRIRREGDAIIDISAAAKRQADRSQ
ncbi:hypothetical protein Goari_005442 [Gossypium aridum]|uniref:CCHC-type domain-containing protein n=1 Tax=Gossypium aridum TaxID=34290 RepID=A0A7J8YU54_GOSAI|nr:hypothetical protein [Gossypium aridum]